ncbi:sulfotransferase family 2 domain-containing protein [Sulfitobacter sp. SK011]|uniref:sulfotransferase family 2 domain-containing protein n=1 Tax=Sulfitobacter sp. SK011 TaxID=1389004 RepID=UPI000E0C491A|nr:sulfotransferase family 2 domain-containing protein [Sulfitobacter sp. SK011]AXI41219.1 Type II secretory pathway, pullulanase PulA [Sulfitobacter sp. SK011]
MIISRGRAYIFVHIPKTGGTSMTLALEDRAMKNDIILGDTPKARNRRRRVKDLPSRGRLWKHSTLADIDGLVAPDELADLFCFTMVRNPWDRVVSYYHWLQEQTFDHPAVGLAKALPFDGFLNNTSTKATLRNWPSTRYMQDAQGTKRCNAYIRLEYFAEDAAPLVQHLGFDLTLPKANRSDRQPDFRGYYTAETQNIIAECCAEDIALFGYSFS